MGGSLCFSPSGLGSFSVPSPLQNPIPLFSNIVSHVYPLTSRVRGGKEPITEQGTSQWPQNIQRWHQLAGCHTLQNSENFWSSCLILDVSLRISYLQIACAVPWTKFMIMCLIVTREHRRCFESLSRDHRIWVRPEDLSKSRKEHLNWPAEIGMKCEDQSGGRTLKGKGSFGIWGIELCLWVSLQGSLVVRLPEIRDK